MERLHKLRNSCPVRPFLVFDDSLFFFFLSGEIEKDSIRQNGKEKKKKKKERKKENENTNQSTHYSANDHWRSDT